ncbi:MAG: hypothetical protein ABI297_01060 [Ginsengibacter sp.]
MTRKQTIAIVLIIIILLPLLMWLGWIFTSKKKMVAVIVDKTVEMTDAEQHASFTWVLNNLRFTKSKTTLYKNTNDYFGFFPMKDEKFRLKGLERFSTPMLDKLSNDADLVYYTDTYGVYRKDWYKKRKAIGAGKIYGGLSEQDIQLLTMMKAKHKLIISEFNTIGTPTSDEIRGDFENLFGLKWSGWIGRYFSSLDTVNNPDLPQWIIDNYKKSNNGKWPFHRQGIVYINTDEKMIVLEQGNELTSALPYIYATDSIQKKYGIPAKTAYGYWFEVMKYDPSINEPIATFKLDVNAAGKEILKKNNLPVSFPAILVHRNADYKFYYFSGNFCDNPISMKSSYFRGIGVLNRLFYPSGELDNPRKFFWNFYNPLLTEIVSDYYQSLQKEK